MKKKKKTAVLILGQEIKQKKYFIALLFKQDLLPRHFRFAAKILGRVCVLVSWAKKKSL